MNHFRRAMTSKYSLKVGASLPGTGDSTSPLIVAPAVANAPRLVREDAASVVREIAARRKILPPLSSLP
jgi:hypothetical protein